jgi:hypothetical protein
MLGAVRRRLGILAIALPLAACGASSASSSASTTSAASAAKHRPCGPASARTLASSSEARVYVAGQVVYGCAATRGRRSYRLGTLMPCFSTPCVVKPRVVGKLVAYGSLHRGVDTGFTVVTVRRLSDGKRLVDDSATLASTGPESFSALDALVLKRDGAVAWISDSQSIVRPGKEVEVVKHDSAGQKLLDSGGGIQPTSLRLQGSTVSWVNAGVKRSAALS